MSTNYPDSVFDILDAEFQTVIANGVTINGGDICSELPQRPIKPLELKAMLLHPSTSFDTRDSTWRVLVERARKDPKWMTIALGLLQPGMRRAAGRLVGRSRDVEACDIDSEFITGVIDAIATTDLNASKLASRLLSAGIDRVRRTTAPGDNRVSSHGAEVGQRLVPNHPELALWGAVEAGVVNHQDAELIATTRLDSVRLGDLTARYGMTVGTLRRRRNRAELRLKEWIHRERLEEIPAF